MSPSALLRLLAWQLPIQEVEHERGDVVALVLQREVAGVEQVQLRVGQIAQVRTRAVGRKNRRRSVPRR